MLHLPYSPLCLLQNCMCVKFSYYSPSASSHSELYTPFSGHFSSSLWGSRVSLLLYLIFWVLGFILFILEFSFCSLCEKKSHFSQSSSSQSTPGTKRVGSCPHLSIKHFCSSYKVGSSDSVRFWHWLLGGSSVPTDLSCMPRQSGLIQKPAPSPRSLPLFLAKQLSMSFA